MSRTVPSFTIAKARASRFGLTILGRLLQATTDLEMGLSVKETICKGRNTPAPTQFQKPPGLSSQLLDCWSGCCSCSKEAELRICKRKRLRRGGNPELKQIYSFPNLFHILHGFSDRRGETEVAWAVLPYSSAVWKNKEPSHSQYYLKCL